MNKSRKYIFVTGGVLSGVGKVQCYRLKALVFRFKNVIRT